MKLNNSTITLHESNTDLDFTNSADVVFPANIQIFHTDGRYKFTDGVTTLGNLLFRGDGTTNNNSTSGLDVIIANNMNDIISQFSVNQEKIIVIGSSFGLIHNENSFILPGKSNIQAEINDTCIFISDENNKLRCISYTNATEDYINFTPTWIGFSTAPVVNNGDCRYKMLSKNTCHFICAPTSQGVSNATNKGISLPFPAANIGTLGETFVVTVYNGGSANIGKLRTVQNSNIAELYLGTGFGSFSASGNSTVMISIIYQIAI
jgi:hypothetical protein